MQPIIYLFFNGTCREAMTAYGEIFGAAPEIMGLDGMPPEVRAEMGEVPGDLVMHAALRIGEGWIYASDDFEGNSERMAGCNVSVTLDTVAEAERVFAALSEGAEVRTPLREEFFAKRFGALTDRFGIRWMIMADGEPG